MRYYAFVPAVQKLTPSILCFTSISSSLVFLSVFQVLKRFNAQWFSLSVILYNTVNSETGSPNHCLASLACLVCWNSNSECGFSFYLFKMLSKRELVSIADALVLFLKVMYWNYLFTTVHYCNKLLTDFPWVIELKQEFSFYCHKRKKKLFLFLSTNGMISDGKPMMLELLLSNYQIFKVP